KAGVALPNIVDLLRDDNVLDQVVGQGVAPAPAPLAAPADACVQCDVAETLRRVLAHAAAPEMAA
ncbi:hypothetical protein ACFDR9_005427, partial [Janthinobacterium sp. CG_23.3]|uniref:hypothetical protein n=1 Tax=Janthinobacterium sp. CG_23.3 TaxID=3349634 RepID=UPI0038D4F073